MDVVILVENIIIIIFMFSLFLQFDFCYIKRIFVLLGSITIKRMINVVKFLLSDVKMLIDWVSPAVHCSFSSFKKFPTGVRLKTTSFSYLYFLPGWGPCSKRTLRESSVKGHTYILNWIYRCSPLTSYLVVAVIR